MGPSLISYLDFRLEDRKFGFLLRNKTISLNICIDVREVFNAKVKYFSTIWSNPSCSYPSMMWVILAMLLQVVRETVWSSLDSSSGPGTELLTLAKTSNLTDLQVITVICKRFSSDWAKLKYNTGRC